MPKINKSFAMKYLDLFKIAGLLLMVLVCNHYARRVKKPLRKFPVAGDYLSNYKTEWNNLKTSIESARTLRQLDYARTFIHLFRKRYDGHKDPVQLQADVNTLRRLYKERRQSVSIRKQIFKEDYYC